MRSANERRHISRSLSRTHPLNKLYSNMARSVGKNARAIFTVIGVLVCLAIITAVYLMVIK